MDHPAALCQIVASVLSFAPVSDAVIALEREQRLPATSTVIGTLTNEFAPDYLVTIADRNTPWLSSPSWRVNGWYSSANPSRRLRAALRPFALNAT